MEGEKKEGKLKEHGTEGSGAHIGTSVVWLCCRALELPMARARAAVLCSSDSNAREVLRRVFYACSASQGYESPHFMVCLLSDALPKLREWLSVRAALSQPGWWQ